jgi:hypothetical protein
MAFGFALAPAMFQSVMQVALSRARWHLTSGTYLDDCTVGHNDPLQCWEDTLEAIKCLLRQGLPINLGKCKFVREEVDILGVTLANEKYKLG